VTVGADGNLSLRAEQNSNDEVGLLALEFNRMVDRLAESKRRLMGLSRKAGMSEVASGVLHNVGNVLAGVNCLIVSLKNAIQNSRMHKLSHLSELLQGHASDLPRFIADDPHGQQVLPYIEQLATRWQVESGHLEADVDALAVNVRHIQSIVDSQQRFATRTQVTEPTQLQGVIAEISVLCEQSLERHGVTICTELDEVLPEVSVDRTRLLEVLVNLVTNAKESLIAAGTPSPTIRISVHRFADECVRIEVKDNGGGIAPENLTQIFQPAFTTKAKGLGFGLHFSALAVKEMGGTLTVSSEGLGRGATLTIDLPCDALPGGPPGLGRDGSIGTPPALTAELCHTG
jgi:signal transduction histidine kinase